jgi:hypothetical protein
LKLAIKGKNQAAYKYKTKHPILLVVGLGHPIIPMPLSLTLPLRADIKTAALYDA